MQDLLPDERVRVNAARQAGAMIDVSPDESLPADADAGLWTFREAVQQKLAWLRAEVGLDTWLLTRVIDTDWMVLQMAGGSAPIPPGTRFPWMDSICYRAVQGLGPPFCPSVSRLPAYAAAPLHSLLGIETYLGVALRRRDGRLFGTLCGIDTQRRDLTPERHRPLLTYVGRTLATMVEREFEIAHENRLASYSLMSPGADRQTGTIDAAQWPQLLADEALTRQALLSPASILAVSAEDRDMTAAARALRHAVGQDCRLARLENAPRWVALVPECDAARAEVLRIRACAFLAEAGLAPCCGVATAMGGRSLVDAAQRAAHALAQAAPAHPPSAGTP